MSFIDAMMAKTESPAKNPLSMLPWGMKCAAIKATAAAVRTFTETSTPLLRSTSGAAFRLMLAPMQKNHTDRIGSVPVIIPLVKEPKNLPVFGANVFKHAPSNSGTIIMPPGIFSMLPLMFMTSSLA